MALDKIQRLTFENSKPAVIMTNDHHVFYFLKGGGVDEYEN